MLLKPAFSSLAVRELRCEHIRVRREYCFGQDRSRFSSGTRIHRSFFCSVAIEGLMMEEWPDLFSGRRAALLCEYRNKGDLLS